MDATTARPSALPESQSEAPRTVPRPNDQWSQLSSRVDALLDAPADRRAALIAELSGGDGTRRAELERLAADLDRDTPLLARPAAECFAALLDDHAAPFPDVLAERYRLMREVGRGGMATIYLTRDLKHARDVAVKVVHPVVAAALGSERFLREIEIVAGLHHPHIVPLFDSGDADGLLYYVMPFETGLSLRQRLARDGALPVEHAVTILRDVCDALAYAHDRGIVHRDIKPDNVMIAGRHAMVTDFGVAKALGATTEAPLGGDDVANAAPAGPISTLGAVFGTPAYMAPEQIARDPAIDHRADIYSLGVLAYELLAGRPPFVANTREEVLAAHLAEIPTPLAQHCPEVPGPLAELIMKCLAKRREDRWQRADELVARLENLAPRRRRASPMTPSRFRWTLAVGATAAVAAVLAAIWARGEPSASRQDRWADTVSASRPRTLALLPFSNDGGNAEDDYLSEGLTHELTRTLATLRSVRVVSRTSALSFTGDQRDVREIGRALNVSAILVGSVQRSSGQLRVRVRLLNGADGTELWSKPYEGSLTTIAALHRELALRIANALEAKLSPGGPNRLGRPGTRSEEALALYLKGRYFSNQRTATSYDLANAYFGRAIAADSQYAAPWAGLAAVYSQQGMSGQLASPQAHAQSRAAAVRAIVLDDGLAEAHAVLGAYLHAYDWDSEGAEREFRRAIDLDPNYAPARLYYGNLLRAIGRLDEAVAQQATAVELDPLVPAFTETLAFTLLRAGRADEALVRVRNALELDSTYWRAHAVLGNVFEATHRYHDAMREFERANQLAGPTAHRTTGDLARVLARTGRRREAGRLLEVLRSRGVHAGIYEPAVATAFYALGDSAAAYDWLEDAYRQRQPYLRSIAGDARFLPMSADPRFLDLLHRLRLAR